MATYHEVKEVTQLEETILTFQMSPYTDDAFRGQPMNLEPVFMTAGDSPYEPTFRITVKAKADDPDDFALFQKLVPPYPDNAYRMGILNNGTQRQVVGGILYVNGFPYWYYNPWSWPSGYTYSPTAPPANWDPDPSVPVSRNVYDLFQGEVSFFLGRYDSWFPPGTYVGTIEMWQTGDGTPPAGVAPALVLQFSLRINRTLRRSPFFS